MQATDKTVRGNQIVHTIEAAPENTLDDVYAWLEQNGWLGYHPAGYGPTTVERMSATRWEYRHWQTCD